MDDALASLRCRRPMTLRKTETTMRQHPSAGRSATSPWKRRLRFSVEARWFDDGAKHAESDFIVRSDMAVCAVLLWDGDWDVGWR